MMTYRWILMLCLFANCAAANDWHTLYGEQIKFEVFRNDRKVGAYETSFARQQQGWQVISEMTLSVTLFLFISWDYVYKAREVWDGQKLKKLEVFESRNGDETRLDGQREKQHLVLDHSGKSSPSVIELPVLTTSHYNDDVLKNERILNTLTGRIDHYQLVPVKKEMVNTNKGRVEAQRYRYEGELTDTEVWYSSSGHWVKLWFKGDDGSDIELRCLYCMK